ncbi:MAG: glutathione S-transferase family protein [Bradyrhizobium sp.]
MTSPPLVLLGAPGSPYTRKMLAALRYRRIPYRLLVGSHRAPTDLPKPKPQLLPTFYFTRHDGSIEAVVDSTPLLRRFERDYPDRKLVPTDPAIAFLDYLLEDFADEWLTKAMFHYRWHFPADADQAAAILPRWSVKPATEATLAPVSSFIKGRQISRLYVVGSNDTTAPVIEASFRRYLNAMKCHLEHQPFLMGARPGASDFAAYGQLTQLARFDPTPTAITLAEAPRIFAWTEVLEDLSGVEPTEAHWISRDNIPATLGGLFAEMGRVYVPVMLANARAVMQGAKQVETEVDGLPWVQEPFPYQAKCIQWIGEEYSKLDGAARQVVLSVIAGTGCERLLTASG